ncbi:MAG TPA: hypothetical protein VF695_04700 [Sphingomonas sp.]|jgi:hypothetical protein
MKPNPGYCPPEAIGKRVAVRLINGTSVPAPGWPADGKGGCNWRRTGQPFEIDRFEVLP